MNLDNIFNLQSTRLYLFTFTYFLIPQQIISKKTFQILSISILTFIQEPGEDLLSGLVWFQSCRVCSKRGCWCRSVEQPRVEQWVRTESDFPQLKRQHWGKDVQRARLLVENCNQKIVCNVSIKT